MPEKFTTREFVRWSDVDKAGIICYGSYVRFFEIAETELFRAIGYPYSKIFDHFDIWLPRKQLHFEFHHPARLDDVLEVSAWVGKIGRTSLRFDVAVHKVDGDSRVLTADGYVLTVATDRQNFRPVPLPQELVEQLRPYSVES